MLMIMDRITDKIGWEMKVFNEEITNKWRAELVNYDEDSDDDDNYNAENEGAAIEYPQKDQAEKEKVSENMLKETEPKELEIDKADGWQSRDITNEMVDWVGFF